MLVFFWGTTLVNLRGVQTSSWIGSVGTIAGSILPGLLVVGLGAAFLLQGHHSQIPFSAHALVPDVQLNNLAFLGGIILLFTGMEMAGFHARDTHRPGRDVPRAITLAVAVIVVFSVLGSLFLAFVLPQKQISLVSGVMELFRSALDQLNIGWLLRPVALIVTLGGVAHLTPWILGPAKGMRTVAEDGYAHPRLARTNAYGVPVQLLIVQAVAGSIFALLFLFVPSVSTSYWMLSAVTAEIVIVMYALMFAAVIKLRYSQPDTPRPYRIPGGLVGVWLAGGIGLLGCVAAFVLGFIPPSQLKTGNPAGYVALLALAVVVLSVPPFVLGVRSQAGRRAEPAAAPAQ
jgi:amino acid transporter